MNFLREKIYNLLRASEGLFKTDMVYLAGVGFWTNLNVIVVSVASLLLSIAFANFLPTDVYGMYQYLLSLSALVGAVCLSGLGTAIIPAVAQGYEGILRAAVRAQLKWASVPATISLACALYYLLQGELTISIGLVIIAFFTPLLSAYTTYSTFLHGKRAFRSMFLFNLFVVTSYCVAMILGVIFLKNALVLITINLGINLLATLYVYNKTLKTYKPNDRLDMVSLSFGKHLSALNAFGTIMNQLDSVLVFHFLGATQLAVYSFATLIPERIGALFGFIGAASLPKLTNQSLEHIQENIFSKVLRVAVFGGIISLLYVLGAPLLFSLVFNKYATAIPFTQIYAPVIALMALTTITNTTLVAKRLTKENYVVGFVQPVLLICLQIPLLIKYGILGMILARIATDVVSILLGLFFTFKPFSKVD
jgi:O-antigen/teichoic acid export membrane protein